MLDKTAAGCERPIKGNLYLPVGNSISRICEAPVLAEKPINQRYIPTLLIWKDEVGNFSKSYCAEVDAISEDYDRKINPLIFKSYQILAISNFPRALQLQLVFRF